MSTTNAETTGLQSLERALWGAFIDGQFVPVGDDQPTFEVIEPSTARPLARVADVTPDSRVGQEEIFGPVARIMRYSTVDEAIEIANGTSYGRRRSFLGSPFGGMKGSGFGRENAPETLHEFVRSKAVRFRSGRGEVPVWPPRG